MDFREVYSPSLMRLLLAEDLAEEEKQVSEQLSSESIRESIAKLRDDNRIPEPIPFVINPRDYRTALEVLGLESGPITYSQFLDALTQDPQAFERAWRGQWTLSQYVEKMTEQQHAQPDDH
jgi:hypothetical protein